MVGRADDRYNFQLPDLIALAKLTPRCHAPCPTPRSSSPIRARSSRLAAVIGERRSESRRAVSQVLENRYGASQSRGELAPCARAVGAITGRWFWQQMTTRDGPERRTAAADYVGTDGVNSAMTILAILA